MLWLVRILLVSFFLAFGCFILPVGALSYTPASVITLTGSDGGVFFDVDDDIFTASTSVPWPRLMTATATFSWAFYLTGAGWVDFSTGSYSVSLDCGAQSLSALVSPCTLSGVAYSEVIWDIIFDRRVEYDGSRGSLSWSIATFVWDYTFSGVSLPLLPAVFAEISPFLARHDRPLSISGGVSRYGPWSWTTTITPQGYPAFSRSYTISQLSSIDLSLATLYSVEIIDPQGSETEFDIVVDPDVPTTSLIAGSYLHKDFCLSLPTSLLCPDGAMIRPTTLSGTLAPLVANGSEWYDFSLLLRDRYGNEVWWGSVRVEYTDTIRNIQTDPTTYINDMSMSGLALFTYGTLINSFDGAPRSLDTPVLGGFTYAISSIAPTSTTDTISLSWVIYTDSFGMVHDITAPAWRAPLSFTPWYTTALTAAPLMVGKETLFTTSYTNTTPAIIATNDSAIYHLDIGSNFLSSYTDIVSGGSISCTKYISDLGIGACNWLMIPDTVIVSTDASSFSGRYSPGGWYDPPPESVSYDSYIRYETWGVAVLYPSASGVFGQALPWPQFMKVLGTQNLEWSRNAQKDEWSTNIWNMLRKNIALLSRNRTDFTWVDYIIHQGDRTITDADFASRRAIVVVGWDITLTTDITARTYPIALIALADETGSGGEIIIDPRVRDIESSLYAEKVLRSSGDNQLYIHGSVVSHNTVSTSKCPYYVSWVCDPDLYNLQKIREAYLDLADKTGHTATTPRALDHSDISVIIEYDGRVLSDPPPVLD
jgi:hypothetical protein